ncbi:MAG: hypothetical protein ACHP8A_18780 [Terriglobales bacterium]
MQKNISLRLIILAVAVLIVLPVNGSVKHLSSNRAVVLSRAALSGSPLPAPVPPGFSIAGVSGSPLPAPVPPGVVFSASGSPLPAPVPPGFSTSFASGSPLPAPVPPGLGA